MATGRVAQTAPQGRLVSRAPSGRGGFISGAKLSPAGYITSVVPSARGKFTSGSQSTPTIFQVGMPFGILLAITRSRTQTVSGVTHGFGPFGRIKKA